MYSHPCVCTTVPSSCVVLSPKISVTSQDNVPHHGWNRTSGIEKRTFRISRCHGCLMTLWNTWVYTWYPKQPVLDGCLVKQPFLCNMIWNHPIETTIYKWMFQVPGSIHPDWYIHVIVGRFYYTMTDGLYIHSIHACDNGIFTYINAIKKSTVHVSVNIPFIPWMVWVHIHKYEGLPNTDNR